MNQHDTQARSGLFNAIFDEAQAALSDGGIAPMRKALENIRAMAQYRAEVDAISDRVRGGKEA